MVSLANSSSSRHRPEDSARQRVRARTEPVRIPAPLDAVFSVALAAVALLSPLFYGGGRETARMGFATLALVLTVAQLLCCARRKASIWLPKIFLPGSVLVAYALVQLIPGPGRALHDLFGHPAISIYPFSGQLAVLEMLGATCWIYLATNYLQGRRQVAMFAAVVLGSVCFQSLYAIYQYVRQSPYMFGWLNPYAANSGFGTFINRDHLAEYVLVAGTFAIGYLSARVRGLEVRLLLAMVGLIAAAGIFATTSRGGIALSICWAISWIGSAIRRRSPRATAYAVGFAIAAVGLIAALAPQRSLQRLLESNWQFESTLGRIAIWQNSVAVWRHFWLAGAGFGNFEFAYEPYAGFTGPVGHLNAAHNEWLQLAIEGGAVAVATVAVALWILISAYKQASKSTEAIALFAALLLAGINSVYEFGLHVAGISTLVAMLLGMLSFRVDAVYRWRPSSGRFAAIAGLVFVLAVSAAAAARHGWAAWIGERGTLPAMEHATELEGTNAARWEDWGVSVESPATRLPLLRKAVELNPWDGMQWARLAGTEVAGSPEQARNDFGLALRVDPHAPGVREIAASGLLLLGDTGGALHQWGAAVRLDPGAEEMAFSATASLAPAARIAQELPPDPQILADYVRWLRGRDVVGAGQVFAQLLGIQPVPPEELTRTMMDDLVDQGQWNTAVSLWRMLAPRYHAAPPGVGDLTNPDFRFAPFDGGLDWRTLPPPSGESISYANECEFVQFPCDTIRFDGVTNPSFFGPFQVVPVISGNRYEFTATVRVNDLNTDSGIELEIRDYPFTRIIAASNQMIGTEEWKDLSVSAVIPSGLRAVCVGLGRPASSHLAHVPLKGTVWLRSIHLAATTNSRVANLQVYSGVGR